MKPFVTLVITTLNRVTYLAESIGSALAQDYENLEILISDNGSHDATPALAGRLAGDDPRVRFRRNDITVPIHEHFTQCVEAARGEYFVLLNDDDRINARFVSELVEVAMRYPAANVVAPSNVIVDRESVEVQRLEPPSGKIFDGPTFVADWWYHGRIRALVNVTTVMYRTETVLRFGGYQRLGAKGQDTDNLLFIQCALTSCVGFAREAVFYCRQHGSSLGSTATPCQVAESGCLFLDHLKRDPETRAVMASLSAVHRRQILQGVSESTAYAVIRHMEVDKRAFQWRPLLTLFGRRRDTTFLNILLRECLRRRAPHTHAVLREIVHRLTRADRNQPNVGTAF